MVANDKAEKEGLNSFETGTITSNDLVNRSEYDGEGFGISGGYGYQNDGPNNPKGTNPTQTETVHVPDGSHSINKNVGYGKDKESESSITQSGIGTSNITVTNNEKQKELTGQTAEEAAKGVESDLTTETVADSSGAIENIFDKDKVQAEIDLQVKVTQQFDRTRQDMKQIINKKIDEYKDADPEKAKDWQNAGLLLDMLAGGLSSPGDGFLGSLAGAANPAVAQMIKGMVNDGTLKEGGLSHILAHGIAGAAMAAANGGDLLSGALTAGGAEALAPIIAEFLYGKGKTPEDLTADEKNTLSAIIGILGTGAGALTGDSAIDAVIGDSVATNAVENNYVLNKIDNCKNLSSKECGRAGDLVNQIFEYNPELPSLDDLNSLLSNCETESCAVKVLQEHHKEISDATLATIKEMGIQGELSREDIAFIESMVGSEILLQLQGSSGETGGGKLWQHELLNSWTNGQELYSFLDNEYRIKELMNEGYSPEDAAAKVGREEFLTTLASMLVGGGKGGNTKSGSSSKGKEEVGKETNDVSASTPTGSKGNVLNIPDGTNKPTTINDRQFSGHALDRMQRQGITPSTVESAINSQNAVVGKIPGTTAYHDKVNNITVITDTKSGRVVTVDFGIIKQ